MSNNRIALVIFQNKCVDEGFDEMCCVYCGRWCGLR
jgi:hypothetical protein